MQGTSRAALALSVLGVAIPKYGIIVTGLSGLFVILSSNRRSNYARVALGINFCNLFILSPVFLMSLFHPYIYEQPVQNARLIFIVVVLIQLATLVIRWRKEKRRAERRKAADESMAEPALAQDRASA